MIAAATVVGNAKGLNPPDGSMDETSLSSLR